MRERMDSEIENKWIKLFFFASPRKYFLQEREREREDERSKIKRRFLLL